MDRLIRRFDAIADADLRICEARGIAYQHKMAVGRVPYDASYLAKVEAYEGTEIARAVNRGRVELLQRHLPEGSPVLDIGAGTGAFVHEARRAGFEAKGYEVIPGAVERLKVAELYAEDPGEFLAVTLWDSIEHMDAPEVVLKRVRRSASLFASIPVFEDLRAIRGSKHYRPGEHLYYWTEQGFVDWMALYGFRHLETSGHERKAGRENIGAFAFRRDLPDYHDHLAAYQEMHAGRHYGGSSTELHLEAVAAVVRRLAPGSILDFGCGRSDLVAHFWRDGKRQIARYDPAIPTLKELPPRRFDLTLCCDVLEHVPMADIDRVLAEVRATADVVLFTISTKPARARLPDGRNAHVTLLTRGEWMRWVGDVFGVVEALPSKWDHELVLLAGQPRKGAA